MIWIFTEGEGDGIKSRLPFEVLSTLTLMLAVVWQISSINYIQWPETKIMWICWNLLGKFIKSHRVNLILEDFIHLKPQCACFMRCSFLDIPQAEFFRQSLRIALFLQEKAFWQFFSPLFLTQHEHTSSHLKSITP